VIVFGVETGEILSQLAATGPSGGRDWRVPLDEARGRVGPGSPCKAISIRRRCSCRFPSRKKRVARVLELANLAGPGHIFNLGHGVLGRDSGENVKALVRQVHAHTPAR